MDHVSADCSAVQSPPTPMSGVGGFSAAGLRAVAAGAARFGGRSSYLILIFHRVLARWDPLMPDEPDSASFAAQLDLISKFLNVLPLSEAVARAQSNSMPPRAACITFDDGYANNLEVAAPLLAAKGLPATVFVATSFLEGGCMWNDRVIEALRCAPAELDLSGLGLPRLMLDTLASRRAAVTTVLDALKYLDPAERAVRARAVSDLAGIDSSFRPMLTEAGVRQLATQGIEIGAHTRTHPILTCISDTSARDEIAGSRQVLRDITGEAVSGFAYPNGRPGRDYERRHVDLVKAAGYGFAVSTAWGCASAGADRYQLPRAAAWDRKPLRYAGRLIRTYLDTRPATV